MLHSKFNDIHRSIFIVLILLTILVLTAYVKVEPVCAQFDFNAYLGKSILDEEIDGIIGSEWDDAGNHPDISIDPQGTAEIWTKHDGTFLYLAMKFMADSANPWVAIQYERANHMSSGADGSLFGHDRLGADAYRDISFGGLGSISDDSTQDGVGAISYEDSNFVVIELKKPLNTGDSNGNDIEWILGNTYTLIIRWDSDGGGSSGGSISHFSGSIRDRIIFLNMEEISEFSSLSIFITLIL